MIYMDSRQDITRSFPFLRDSADRFLEDFFNHLHEMLGQGGMCEPFRLSDHGYALLVLNPDEACSDFHLENWSLDVEYAELIDLGDCQLFKVCLMEDNERFTFLISIVGSQSEATEAWLANLVDGGACS